MGVQEGAALQGGENPLGMIVGIACGAVLVVIAVIAIACYVDRRGQGKRAAKGAQPRLPDAPRAMEEGTAGSSTGGAAHVHPDGKKTLPPPGDEVTPGIAPAQAPQQSRKEEVAELNETVPLDERSGVKEKAPSKRKKRMPKAPGEQNAVRV